MMLPKLPNNRLILNGHKILNQNQLFDFVSKRLKTTVLDSQELQKTLKKFQGLQIAIWHGENFLEKESKSLQEEMIQLLSNLGNLKISRRKKQKAD